MLSYRFTPPPEPMPVLWEGSPIGVVEAGEVPIFVSTNGDFMVARNSIWELDSTLYGRLTDPDSTFARDCTL